MDNLDSGHDHNRYPGVDFPTQFSSKFLQFYCWNSNDTITKFFRLKTVDVRQIIPRNFSDETSHHIISHHLNLPTRPGPASAAQPSSSYSTSNKSSVLKKAQKWKNKVWTKLLAQIGKKIKQTSSSFEFHKPPKYEKQFNFPFHFFNCVLIPIWKSNL